jgi:O-antigen ligase
MTTPAMPAGAPRTNPIRVLAWAWVALGIVYLLFLGGGFQGIYSVHLRVVSLVAICVTLVAWLAFAWRHPAWRPTTAIWPAFVVGFGAMALSTLTSPTPRLGLDYLAYAVLLTGLYLLLVRLWADPFTNVRLGVLTVATAFGICLAYIGVVGARWIEFWGLVGAIRTPPLRPLFEGLSYGNPSAVLTVALLLVTAAVAYMGIDSARRRTVVAVLIVLVCVVILMTGSRAGWLAVPAAFAITSIVWLLVPDHRTQVRELLRDRRIAIGVGAVLVVGVVIAAFLAPVILLRASAGGEEGRATFFAAAIRMFAAAPLTGVGMGGWAADRIAYTKEGEIDYYIPHAHDLYFQAAAELGIVGLVAGAIALGCLIWLIAGALRDDDAVRRRFGWASLFGLAYFGIHQFLDFYPNMPAALFAFALPIAWLDSTARRTVGQDRVRVGPLAARVGRVALFAGVIVAVATLAWSESVALKADGAVGAANRRDWEGALPLIQAAAREDPALPSYAFTLGLVSAALGDLPAARREFETAANGDQLPEAWLDLAAIQLREGDPSAARETLSKALRLGVQQPANDVAAAWMYLRMDDPGAATASLAEAIAKIPSLAGDPYLAADPGFATIRADAVARALATADEDAAWEIALVSGDPATARSLAGQLVRDDRVLAETVIDAWGGSQPAVAALDALARQRALDRGTLSWAARVARRSKDDEAAARYQRWGALIGGITAAETRIVESREAGDPISGSNTGFHSQYVYRRPAPTDHLVPWLPRLTDERAGAAGG